MINGISLKVLAQAEFARLLRGLELRMRIGIKEWATIRIRTGHDADPRSLADAGAAPGWVLRRARRLAVQTSSQYFQKHQERRPRRVGCWIHAERQIVPAARKSTSRIARLRANSSMDYAARIPGSLAEISRYHGKCLTRG